MHAHRSTSVSELVRTVDRGQTVTPGLARAMVLARVRALRRAEARTVVPFTRTRVFRCWYGFRLSRSGTGGGSAGFSGGASGGCWSCGSGSRSGSGAVGGSYSGSGSGSFGGASSSSGSGSESSANSGAGSFSAVRQWINLHVTHSRSGSGLLLSTTTIDAAQKNELAD